MFLNFDITHVPNDVKNLAHKAAIVTSIIGKDLKSPFAAELAALIPNGGTLLIDAQNACEKAMVALNAIQDMTDNPAYSAILQRLGSDLTKIAHSSEKHTISFYITSFEIIWHDLFGKQA